MRFILLLSLGIGFIINSCIPLSQFNDLKKENSSLERKTDSLIRVNEKLMVDNKELGAKLKVLEQRLKTYEESDISGSVEYVKLKEDYENLKNQLNQLKSSQQFLLENSAEETTKILAELQKTQEELQAREDRLNRMEVELNRKKQNLDQMTSELESKNKRLIELERILFMKDSLVTALKNKISDALLGFQNQGLTITQKNGKVYVSLEEKLLFKTGSYEVDSKGRTALKNLAKVLEQNPEIDIMVEGHTDDVPYIAGEIIKDNWDLSVMRATAIVKILLEGNKINPKRLIASGRGEFLPVDNRKTSEARQKNRRTEIILYPKLDELYEIIESQ